MMRPRPFPHGRALFPWLVLLGAWGCADTPMDPGSGEWCATVTARSGGLVISVELSDPSPAVGDTFWVRARVQNQGAPREVEARICGLDLEGLPLHPTLIACHGYSARWNLPTGGSSSWTEDARVVAGPPGQYRLRVRHLLEPETWVQMDVLVQAGPESSPVI